MSLVEGMSGVSLNLSREREDSYGETKRHDKDFALPKLWDSGKLEAHSLGSPSRGNRFG